MSARDNLNPDQLKLFMTGTEWQASVHDSYDRMGSESMDDLWEDKLNETQMPVGSDVRSAGLYDKMRVHGYRQNPREFRNPTINFHTSGTRIQEEGHHRIAAAAELERQGIRTSFIPTNYRRTTILPDKGSLS